MTQEQVEKAQKLSTDISTISDCIYYLNNSNPLHEQFNSYIYKSACFIAKDEVLPIFEKKLQELKDELAAL